MPKEIWGMIFMITIMGISFKYDPFWGKMEKLEDKIDEWIEEDEN